MTFSVQSGKVDNFTAAINSGWYTVEFDPAFPSNVVPVVFAQIQTRNGQDTPGLRLRNISNSSFEVRMDEIISSNAKSSTLGELGTLSSKGDHPNAEILGWMAIAQ